MSILMLLACTSGPAPHPDLQLPAVAPPGAWPDLTARVVPLAWEIPEDFGHHRVFLDPGHGARRNPGNTGCECQVEQDEVLRIATRLAARLEGTGHFDVRLARTGEDRPSYARRVRAAERWPADVFLSIHTDYRGAMRSWSPGPGLSCARSEGAAGFSVLYSPDGDDDLVDARLGLARALSLRLAETGIAPFTLGYGDLYTADDEVPGTYAHTRKKRIYVLRTPEVPSILVEAHNAADLQEVARWRDPRVREAFEHAVVAGLVDWLSDEEGVGGSDDGPDPAG